MFLKWFVAPAPENSGKTKCCETFPPFPVPVPSFLWFSLFSDLLLFHLLFSDSSTFGFRSVHTVESLTLKFPSIKRPQLALGPTLTFHSPTVVSRRRGHCQWQSATWRFDLAGILALGIIWRSIASITRILVVFIQCTTSSKIESMEPVWTKLKINTQCCCPSFAPTLDFRFLSQHVWHVLKNSHIWNYLNIMEGSEVQKFALLMFFFLRGPATCTEPITWTTAMATTSRTMLATTHQGPAQARGAKCGMFRPPRQEINEGLYKFNQIAGRISYLHMFFWCFGLFWAGEMCNLTHFHISKHAKIDLSITADDKKNSEGTQTYLGALARTQWLVSWVPRKIIRNLVFLSHAMRGSNIEYLQIHPNPLFHVDTDVIILIINSYIMSQIRLCEVCPAEMASSTRLNFPKGRSPAVDHRGLRRFITARKESTASVAQLGSGTPGCELFIWSGVEIEVSNLRLTPKFDALALSFSGRLSSLRMCLVMFDDFEGFS